MFNIKHRLITKLITELVCKLRDKFIKTINPSLVYGYCSNLLSNHGLIRLKRFGLNLQAICKTDFFSKFNRPCMSPNIDVIDV